MKNRFGIHIRLKDSLRDALSKADALDITLFQVVLMLEKNQKIEMSQDEIHDYLVLRRQYNQDLFVHGSYWSTITNITGKGFQSLLQEIELAEKLKFTHIVIHPGSFATHMTKNHRINYITRAVNLILKSTNHITLVLENSPHSEKSFSCKLDELGELCKKVSQPDRLKICIDTAHAFVAGYDISDPQKVESFVQLLADTIGIDNIGLLHCNDTKQYCGSYIDKHAVPGHGNIGMAALYSFVHHPVLQHIPVIFEMPVLDVSVEQDIIEQFRNMEFI